MPDEDDVIRLPTGTTADRKKAPEVDYDVGGYPPHVPLVGSYKVAGTLTLKKQLPLGAQCTIQVAGPDGEIVAIGEGHISAMPFIEHDDKDLFWVERQHKISV